MRTEENKMLAGDLYDASAPEIQAEPADQRRDPASRASGMEFGCPVRIGGNVWVGAGAIILPGVSTGDRRGQRGHA